MSSALTLRFSTQAQSDIQRITSELADLQRQTASGMKANDLSGYGESASRLISANGARSLTDSRASVVNQLSARFDVQDVALRGAADSSNTLAKAIRDALSANDGRGLSLELNLAFTGTINALNETWNGQPLFAGERVGGDPIKVSSLNDLLGVSVPSQLYDEASRPQTLDLGAGAPVQLADKASDISWGAFQAMRQLQLLLNQAGGEIGSPPTGEQTTALQDIASQLEAAGATFNSAEGRAGQLSARFDAEATRLQDRSALLVKEVGGIADADIAQVSVQLNTLLVQYQASAKTFSDLSKLTLLSFL